jgi:hypothetical protein
MAKKRRKIDPSQLSFQFDENSECVGKGKR